MRKITLLVCLIALVGCERPFEKFTKVTTGVICEKSTVEKRANFILACIQNANPKSDEEPEDWLYYCENFSDKLYCKEEAMEVTCYDKWCHIKSLPRLVGVN